MTKYEARAKNDIGKLLSNPQNGKYTCVVAPMVRYSRREFRSLTRKYGAELCFTPMIIANSFVRSEKCRQIEFTTNLYEDRPLIAQFAANNSTDFLYASQMLYDYVDGVNLNAGCAQNWTKKEGYGCYLLKKPEILEDIIKTFRRNMSSDFSISIKIRLLCKDIMKTIDLCRSLDVSFIAVHGRTPCENSSADFPVDANAIKEIKQSVHVPVIFNGDIFTLEDADKFYDITKCDGMMAARGILTNPALFSGAKKTPLSCVQDWIDIHHQQNDKMTFQTFHHHLCFMLEDILNKSDRIHLNSLSEKMQCLEYLKERLSLTPKSIDYPENTPCIYDDSAYKEIIASEEFWSSYSSETSHGKYFLSKLNKVKSNHDDYLEFMDDCSSLFS